MSDAATTEPDAPPADAAGNGPAISPPPPPDAAVNGPVAELPAPEEAAPTEPRSRGKTGRIEALEARVRKLEKALAALLDSPPAEQKVMERLAVQEPAPALVMTEAPETNSDPAPAPAPMAAMAPEPPLAAVAALAPAPALSPTRRGWFVFECLYDLRNVLRMIGDPRYRMTWLGRLLPFAFLAFFILSDMDSLKAFFPWNLVPAVGWLLNKAIVLLFGFVTFKVLLREIRRYRETIPDAPG